MVIAPDKDIQLAILGLLKYGIQLSALLYLPNWSTSLQRADVGPYPFSHCVSHIVQIGFEPPLPCSGKSGRQKNLCAGVRIKKLFQEISLVDRLAACQNHR
jgi:hypothetical protein